jgi:hypothetical protein
MDHYATHSQSNSTDLLSGLGSTAVSNFKFTTAKKPGGSEARLQFSNDNISTVKNANGDDATNAGAYFYDGVNDNMVRTSAVLTAPPISMSIWFKTKKSGTQVLMGMYDKDSSTWYAHYIAINSSNLLGANSALNNTFVAASAPAVLHSLGEWHHVAGVWASTTSRKIYVDGVLRATNTTSNVPINIDCFAIGASNTSTPGNWFSGELDDARIYDVALTDDQVWELYSRHKENNSGDLIAHWKLDGNANDATGNGHTLTISGAASITNFYELPSFGEGATEDVDTLSFDGTDDYVEVASTALAAYPHTMGAWVKTNTIAVSQTIMSNADTAGSDDFSRIGLRSTGVWFMSVDDGTETVTDGYAADLKWNYVVGVFASATDRRLYVNGALHATSTTSRTAVSEDTLSVGRRGGSVPAAYFNGLIANAAFWDDERTVAEILTDYQNGYIDMANANLVAFWPLNEGTGTNAEDCQDDDKNDCSEDAGTDYDGTISGASWIKTLTRPVPAAPTQQTIDISGLGFTDDLYVRTYMPTYQQTPAGSYAFTEYTAEYSAGGRTRRIVIVR